MGLISQQRFADAFEAKALEVGYRLGVSVRRIRTWESAEPPWPTPDYQAVVEALFDPPITSLGFVPPVARRRTESGCGSWMKSPSGCTG
ncbi:hypothetical protein [Embleya sp. NPDC001921]